MNDNKAWYVAIGVVILALIIWGIYAINKSDIPANTTTQTTQNTPNNNADQTASTTPEATTTPVTGAPAKKLSYGQAVNAYKFRFQFLQCHGNPGTLAVKQGTVVMLDNRDAVAHTIKADKQTFKIAGYDYALLHTSALGDLFITCDGGGAAKLNVQK